MNLDKLVVFEVFFEVSDLLPPPIRWVTVIYKHPGGQTAGLGLDLVKPHLRCQASFKTLFPEENCSNWFFTDRVTETMPSSLRAFEHGSPAVGGSQCFEGQCVPGCWALKWVFDNICNVCRKKHRKKTTTFFRYQRVIMKNPARFFHFALDKVRLLSNFQVILSETGSIFGGSGALVVAAGAVVGFQRPIGVFDGLASQQNRTRCKFCWQYRWHFCPKKAKL